MKITTKFFLVSIIFWLLAVSNITNAQVTVSVSGATSFVECGVSDTIIVRITNNSAVTANNITVDIPFQPNMVLVDSITNVVFTDTSNTNYPILGLKSDSILAGQTDSIVILVRALCGYVTGGPVIITANVATSVGSNSALYNGFSAYSPDITITEIGGPFNVVDRIDSIERIWEITQIQPNAYLTNAYIQNDFVDMRFIDIQYDSMGVYTFLDSQYYTVTAGKLFIHLDSSIFKFYGNQDDKLNNGEPIRIKTRFRTTFCAPTSDASAGFSCDTVTDKSNFCETTTSVFSSISVIQQTNSGYGLLSIVDSTSTMSTCNERVLRIKYVNTSVETAPGSGSLYDLKARLLIPDIRNQEVEQTQVIIDGYVIDSVEYLPIFGTAAYPHVFLGPEIPAQIPGSKLTDLDGDGEFDDLAAGDTITMEFVIKKHRPSTIAEGYGQTQTTPILFTKGCNTGGTPATIGSLFFTGQEGMHIRSSNLITKVHPTLNIGDSTFYSASTIRFYGSASTNCGDSVELKMRIRITEGVDVVPGSYIQASSSPGNHLANVITQIDSVNWDVTFRFPDPFKNGALGNFNRNLGRYHQTNIHIRLSPDCDYYTQNDACLALTGATMEVLNVLYQCATVCSGAIDHDSIIGVNVLSPDGIIQVTDTNNICAFSPGASNSITTDYIDIYRTTFGYADETYTTPFSPNTIDSVEFISGDSLVFKMNGVIRGGTYDSVRIIVDVPNASGNTGNFLDIDWLATNINLVEASTGLTRTCNILDVVYSFASSQNTYTFTFPLSCLSLDGVGDLEIGDSLFFEAIGRLPFYPGHDGLASGFLNGRFSYSNGGAFQECNTLTHYISSVGYRRLYRINEAGYRNNGSCDGLFLEYRLVYTGASQRDYRPIFNLDSVTLDMDNTGTFFVIDTTRPILYYDRFADDFIPLPSNAVNIINNRKARLYNLGDTTLNPQDANNTAPVTGNYKFNVKVPFDVNCSYVVGNNYTSNRFTLHGDYYAHSNYLSNGLFNDTTYSTLIYRAAGGPAFINTDDNISYIFNSIQSTVVVDNVTDTFSFSITNTSHQGATPTIGASYPYVYIEDPNGYLNIHSAYDALSNVYNVTTLPGIGHLIELDTFGLNEIKTMSLVFQPTSCGSQSFNFTPAWNCGGYPADSNLLGCGNAQTRVFSYTPSPANISIQLVNDNISPNICDTIVYGIQITNPSGGAVDSLSFIYFSPDTTNIDVVTSTVNFEGNTYNVVPTFTPPNRYAFDLKNQVFDSVVTLGFDPNDTLLFNLNIEPLCGIYVGLYNAFTAEGTQACGGALTVPAVISSSPMNFNGTTPVYNSNISLSGSGILNSCGYSNYNIKWYNFGGAPGFNNTTLNDSIWIILPAGMSYSPGSFQGVYNAPLNPTPSISVKPNGTYVSWGLNAGIAPGDSIEFNIGLTASVADTCGTNYEVQLESVRVFNLDCDGVNCPTPSLSSADTSTLTNNKSVLTLVPNSIIQDGCNDSIQVNIGLYNSGLSIANGTTSTIYFVADSNNNGVFDSTDVLLTSYSTTDSIQTGDTLQINYTFYPNGYTNEVCGIIAFLDTSSCVCSGDTTIAIPVTLTYPISDTVICEGDSVNFNICSGTAYYAGRTYDWNGATNLLSDSTILSPVFRAPTSILNDTTYTFTLYTDRDSCFQIDTINITVNAAPFGTLNDTMICLGDSVTLNSIADVYFEVWTAATGGVLIDTTAFKVSPTVTTTYYLTAIDSAGGCRSLNRDSVTIYVDTILPTIACPGNLILCEGDTANWSTPVANDNCGVSSLTSNITPGVVLAPGVHTVTYVVTDLSGNQDSCSFTVTVNPQPYLQDFHLARVRNCADTVYNSISFMVASDTFPVSYWFYNATDTIFSGVATTNDSIYLYDSVSLPHGTYNFVLLNPRGCSSDSLIVVNNNAQPLVLDSLSAPNNVCYGDSATIYIRIKDGVGPYDYYLFDGIDTVEHIQSTTDTVVIFDSLPAGNYWVDVVDFGQIDWYHLLGGSQRERAVMTKDKAGNIYIIGGTESPENNLGTPLGGIDGFIVKIDNEGHIIWRKRYGTSGLDYLLGMKEMRNGEFVAWGYKKGFYISQLYTNHDCDIWLMRLDANGNILFDTTYGGTVYDQVRDLVELPSGDLFMIGGSRSNNGDFSGNHGGLEDGFALRTDANLNLQWTRLYGSTGQDGLSSLSLLTSGEVFVVGWCGGNNGDVSGYHGGGLDSWILRLDTTNGNILYQNAYGGSGYEYLTYKYDDSSYTYYLGLTNSNNGDITVPGHGNYDGLVVRFNKALDTIDKQYKIGTPQFDEINSIIGLNNGGFISAGSIVNGSQDGWVATFDSTGTTTSSTSYGGSIGTSYYGAQYEGLGSVEQSSDNFYIFAGSYHSTDGPFIGNKGREDVLAFKLGVKYCSIATINILQVPEIHDTINRVICFGDSINIGLNYYDTAGTYIDTLISYQGCDSIVTLNLQVDSFINETIDTMICNGQSIIVHGTSYSTPGVYYDTLLTINGCDSIRYSLTLIFDTIPPSVTCQDTTIYLPLSGSIIIDTSYVLNTLSDNCTIDSVWLQPSTFTCLDTGLNQVMIYVRDNNGNLDSCQSNVTVLDTIPPTITCQDTSIYLGATGTISIDTSYVLGNVSDNCGVDSVWFQPSTFTCLDTGLNQVTVYVRDNNGLIDSCQSNVTVLDTLPPSITCQDTTVYLGTIGTITIDTSYVLTGLSDNCGIDSVWFLPNNFTCADTGVNQVTIYVRDNNGNLDSCLANVTILDTIPPSIICQDTTVYLSPLGSITIDTSFVIQSVSDNCGVDSVWLQPSTFTCADTGLNQVTIYVRDNNGNLDSCQSNVTVLDTILPSVTCVDTTIYIDSNGMYLIDTSYVYSSSYAGCGIDSVWLSRYSFTCSDIGVVGVYVYARDVNNNLDSCLANVTVLDTLSPTPICLGDWYDTIANSCDYQVPNFINNLTLNDNCSDSLSIQVTQQPMAGTIIDGAQTTSLPIRIYVTDTNGNIDSCEFTLYLYCEEELLIPEFISPNGDGQNDYWYIEGIWNYPESEVQIYNRWGSMVYTKKGYDNSWRGEISTKAFNPSSEGLLPSGTYFFILKLNDGTKRVYRSIVHIRK